MAMIPHSHATTPARDICDAVLAGLRSFIPEIARKENPSSCAFHHPRHKQFVWVNHWKEHVVIEFLGNHEDAADIFPPHLGIYKRAHIRTEWDKAAPFRLNLNGLANVTALCRLLIDYSYPLSHGKRKGKGFAVRPLVAIPEEVLPPASYNEGSVAKVVVNRYERDPKAREICIASYGAVCCLCGFDFVLEFGEAMAGFIHVHHLKQLSTVGEGYAVDPIADLRPVCPNCHAVIHRREPPFSIEEVQAMRRPRLRASP
jgi:hypothetical protein